MMKIIRMSGTFLKTDGPKPKEKPVFDEKDQIEREFCEFPFDNEEQRKKFLEFVFHVRSQVNICHAAGYGMGIPYGPGLMKCGVSNGIHPVYKCGPEFKSPCQYMKIENVIIHQSDKKGLVIRCLAPVTGNA